ncbi:rhombosortase [Sansalvadorimonas sp. 2012CJ34-2]|uniref:Rhombosortase n=1 Tax=Parendozoicomonas callyspongiae TaxID=2942213 RepID=A0ABT0PJ14_9GAMM|nr:rhombosortase [Sansalvadorimonas sp. 2012CJ34-2]MCL6271382.1 rhombosortase [Sansalvadorimonas sp. 2012CJ34-2]
MAPTDWQDALAYTRSGLVSGDWWRLLSGHWIHLSWYHLLMNGLVLIAFYVLYGERQKISLCMLFFLSITISGGLWLKSPGIERYVGFSGVLTGLILIGAINTFSDDRLINTGIVLVILGKIAIEQWQPHDVITSALTDIPTVVDAHLYGALAGILYCILLLLKSHLMISRGFWGRLRFIDVKEEQEMLTLTDKDIINLRVNQQRS